MSEALAARVRNISRVVYATIALLVFVGDQTTKSLVDASIPEHEVRTVIPGFFNLTHVKNGGAAFGLFADSPAPWKTGLLILISAALLASVIGVVWKSRRLQWEAGVGLSLVLGGLATGSATQGGVSGVGAEVEGVRAPAGRYGVQSSSPGSRCR